MQITRSFTTLLRVPTEVPQQVDVDNNPHVERSLPGWVQDIFSGKKSHDAPAKQPPKTPAKPKTPHRVPTHNTHKHFFGGSDADSAPADPALPDSTVVEGSSSGLQTWHFIAIGIFFVVMIGLVIFKFIGGKITTMGSTFEGPSPPSSPHPGHSAPAPAPEPEAPAEEVQEPEIGPYYGGERRGNVRVMPPGYRPPGLPDHIRTPDVYFYVDSD
ncbi:hypothetical protein FLONG3_10596 [Fusarium longipes]|uniref:Uncharacterized protein n=1 Tax=Fusarium longipes TaxID=694270 RepID=A0A395RMD7_9HYPO|nr:hypothetical protein FLONG3_10596 [Fusarium longipes]